MSDLITKLTKEQSRAMSLRPKVGGFPVLAEVLRQAGVKVNRWTLPSCQSVYLMQGGNVLQQGTPIVTGLHEIPLFQKEKLIEAIRSNQEGKTTFPEFLMRAWNAGVVGYDVDLIERKVLYYGANGESYIEIYPSVPVD
ncbi:DUF1398 domain-containing protein [Leptospira kemamanensis]|uniref:DUF1398 domain-containing protein n=1 Tax=Leptospira kemamanensis TaxID=2484942 RepID=A0A4R9JMQ7_9LEPT|nr:DUF1398 family protein [Leptospira kemamanensis]TGL48677.1 DUF1398 domain-containing protein [Leptospira kemamanensis]